ncbi:hypothetical protein OS965_01080 [Streptomyces sp. H27-G5]|nr:hypothetical protein [Streptomyces sp. H27-G5]MCY0916769.1 hypothetical protein [Streptomyces sp. H27-G5]
MLDVRAALLRLLLRVQQHHLVRGLVDDPAVLAAPLAPPVVDGESLGEGRGDLAVEEAGELPLPDRPLTARALTAEVQPRLLVRLPHVGVQSRPDQGRDAGAEQGEQDAAPDLASCVRCPMHGP